MDCCMCPPLCFHTMAWSHILTRDWPQGCNANQNKVLVLAEWTQLSGAVERVRAEQPIRKKALCLYISLCLSLSFSLCLYLCVCSLTSCDRPITNLLTSAWWMLQQRAVCWLFQVTFFWPLVLNHKLQLPSTDVCCIQPQHAEYYESYTLHPNTKRQ